MLEPKKSQDAESNSITLTPEQSQMFQSAMKIGIYKELNRKGLLTDEQLNRLISMQNT